MTPALTPRILWVELTSKCPFDCVFCSRKTRRGAGEHLSYAVFESLVRQVSSPRTFLLNYSGESTVYPNLIPAIRLARSTGARVELVSALAAAPDSLLQELSVSGLTRLTVSLHAATAESFDRIYRHSSLARMHSRLERLLGFCRDSTDPPTIDLAFVAMQENLDELPAVAETAHQLGLATISIFPIIRRDEIPMPFPSELDADGLHRAQFRARLNRTVDTVTTRLPGLSLTICNPRFHSASLEIGESPRPCPSDLPARARIYSCEQNPWETAHVLSNGDLVACEVHDRTPLGNLARQSLDEIWNGDLYSEFRRRYAAGDLAECRSCPWKSAYLPGPLRSDIFAARGLSAQLGHGWHQPSAEPHIWSSQQASATLAPRAGSREVLVDGILPPAEGGAPNQLHVLCNGTHLGSVENASGTMLSFDRLLPIPPDATSPWNIEFETSSVCIPRARGESADQRDLGFALRLLSSLPPHARNAEAIRSTLKPLVDTIHSADRFGALAAARFARPVAAAPLPPQPGISVIIPERANLPELTLCLAALREAARQFQEPVQVLIVVNGSLSALYRNLQTLHPYAEWLFYSQPLGFTRAIRAGLRRARYPWTYLVNSDAELHPSALATAAHHREPSVFSIASQILLKDSTRFRDETNLTTVFLDHGLVSAHDLIPHSPSIVEHFYSGGGASLFKTQLLRQFLQPSAYHPFYWEDIEWGWRARKSGFHALFCPGSIARHIQGATIAHHFRPEEIEAVRERHRLLFQLRNLTSAGSPDAVLDAIASGPRETAEYFTRWPVRAGIWRSRIWNHMAPLSDQQVLAISPAVAFLGRQIGRLRSASSD